MISIYILLGLFQNHIHVIGLHDRMKIDYCIEAKNKQSTCSDVKCFEIYIIFYCYLHRIYFDHGINTLQIANLIL
jgi:hypothetical protein